MRRPIVRFCLAGVALLVFFQALSFVSPSGKRRGRRNTAKEAIAAPRADQGDAIYSAHNCVGVAYEGNDLDNNRCHFQNVCLELLEPVLLQPDLPLPEYPWSEPRPPQSFKLTYFRPRVAETAPFYWNDLIGEGRPWVRVARDSYLTPTMEYSAIPSDALWSPSQQAVLQEAYWPENFGHSMGDDFLPAYRLVKSFGSWDRADAQIIMHPPCSMRDMPEQGCRNHDALAPLLLDRPLETNETSLFTSARGRPVCFRNLYVGTKMLGMSLPSEHVWPGFVDELRVGAGLDITQRPKRQRISIFLKHGRRTVLNYKEVENHLRDRFKVEVDLIDPAKLSLADQIKYMHETTVVVSPCGGISFSSMFLPPGASAIFIDYWDTHWNASGQMERFIYTNKDDLTPFYYPVEKEEVLFDRSVIPEWGNPEDDYMVYRNWANLTVNLERMERYVLSALINAEVANGWQKSFALEPR
ncbi:hypothetical protein JCM10212_006810 [Sporobolomyces blumeae]